MNLIRWAKSPEYTTCVEEMTKGLKALGISVFYDNFEQESLWGKSGAEEFEKIFSEQSAYVVMFISKEYKHKAWPRHERRSAFSRMIKEDREYILPVHFDDTRIEGIPDNRIHFTASEYTPAELARKIAKKLDVPLNTGANHPEPVVNLEWIGVIVSDPRFHGWIKFTHWGNDTHPRPPQKGDTVRLAGSSGHPVTITEVAESRLGGWKVNTASG